MARRVVTAGDEKTETLTAPPSPAAVRTVCGTLATLITCVSLAWTLDIPRSVGLLLFPSQFLVTMLGLTLVLIFLSIDARREADGAPPFYDLVAAVVAAIACGWVAVRYPVLSEEVFYRPVEALSVSLPMLLLVIEALRRVAGWPLVCIVLAFIAYGLAAHLVPGKLAGLYSSPTDLATYLALDTNGVVGFPLFIGSTVVVAFVLFGQLLNRAGGAAFITEFSTALMGRFRGGSAKIAVVGSSLFGTISGSAVANVASTGVITIPLMRRAGYGRAAAGGIEAVASTGGQLMPPVMGAAAFLMAEFLNIPYKSVVVAAFLPAILYYVAVFVVADLDAARAGIRGVERGDVPPLLRTVLAGWHYIMPFVVLILALFTFNRRPEVSATYAAAVVILGGLVFGYKGRRVRPFEVFEAIRRTGYAVRDIVMIVAAAGIVIGVLQKTGLASALPLLLLQLAGGQVVPLLLIAAFVGILLGMGMPTVGVYVLLATLVAPSLVQAGIPPIAAHLYVLYFGMMSMITPPIAIAAFAAASLAQAEPMRTGVAAMRYGWSAYVIPFIFIASPALLFAGPAAGVGIAFLSALAGVWLGSAALAGHFFGPLGTAYRAGLAVVAVALLLPQEMGYVWVAAKVVGAVAAVLLIAGRAARHRLPVARR
ncbi:MAG: TRAP transporter permease [Alphaproteobacteria bacterium]